MQCSSSILRSASARRLHNGSRRNFSDAASSKSTTGALYLGPQLSFRQMPTSVSAPLLPSSSTLSTSRNVPPVSRRVTTAVATIDSQDTNGRDEDKKKAAEYSSTMQAAMGDAALVYRHELGMNYATVLPDLFVGSCLQTPEDALRLREEAGVGTVFCLQQDTDLEYFGLHIAPIVEGVDSQPGMQHVRHEIRDFDPFSLRTNLPMAVAKLHKAFRESHGPCYIHCTAGLGRAPAVALAYMFWFRGFQLNEANQVLQKVRRCSPKLASIRAATCDIPVPLIVAGGGQLTGGAVETVDVTWRARGTVSSVELSGLDVGWHNKLRLEREGNLWVTHRQLPVGTYVFKFIVDGQWTTSPDLLLTAPDASGMVNNYIEVVGNSFNSPEWALRKRLMEDDAELTPEDRSLIVERLDAMAAAL